MGDISQAEHDAALKAKQTAEDEATRLATENQRLKDEAEAAATAAAASDHQAELDAKDADVKAAQDERDAAKKALDDKEAADKAAADKEAADKAAADRLESRRAEVATIGVFSKDALDKRMPEYATIEDEAWEAKLGELREIATAHGIKPVVAQEPVPVPGKDTDGGGSALGGAATDAEQAEAYTGTNAAVALLRQYGSEDIKSVGAY